MGSIKRIAISTGGGDAPGLNAVIRAATLAAIERGWEVRGIKHGYRSLLNDEPLMVLDRDAVRGIAHLGGTILGTANRGDPFHYPTRETPDGPLVPCDRSGDLVKRCEREGIDAMIAIGGDGSLTIAKKLLDKGLPLVVGVPKTIDNDVAGTDVTFGFETAVSIATEALDRLLALRFGAAAIGEIAAGKQSGMVAMRNGEVTLVPLEDAAGKTRTVPIDKGLVHSARDLGICFGDEAETCFAV